MCLLVTQSKTSPELSQEWTKNFYSSNADGIGVMYAQDGELIIKKSLPKSPDELHQFYLENISGKDCAYHLRMRTHGDIDILNCHPYEILNQSEHGLSLWMMHNGVLASGNKKDSSKSDTWHYINDYLRPILEKNPELAFNESFKEYLETHIGSGNKFVLMDNLGRQSIINQSSGVFWGGLWLSNTYAWSAPKDVSKNPIKSIKAQRKQVKESPRDISRYMPSSYSGIYPMSGQWMDDDEQYLQSDDYYAYEIECYLDDMKYMGYSKASEVSINDCLHFVDIFGIDSFFDVAESLIDGSITEKWFIDSMRDHAKAREAFPHLSRALYRY